MSWTGINPNLFSSSKAAPNFMDTASGKGVVIGGCLFLLILFPVIIYLLFWHRHPEERFTFNRGISDSRSTITQTEADLESGDNKLESWKAKKRLSKSRPKSVQSEDVERTSLTSSGDSDATITPGSRPLWQAVDSVGYTIPGFNDRLPKTRDSVRTAVDGANDELPPTPSTPTSTHSRFSLPTGNTTFAPYNLSLATKHEAMRSNLQTPTSPRTPAFERNTIYQDPDELHLSSYSPTTIPTITIQHPTPSTTARNSPRQSVISIESQEYVNQAVTMSIAHIRKPVPTAAAAINTKRSSWSFGGLSPKIVEIGKGKVEALRNIRW